MAIIKKELGNRRDIIIKEFRKFYSDGLDGLAFSVFCRGWKAGWKEYRKQVLESK